MSFVLNLLVVVWGGNGLTMEDGNSGIIIWGNSLGWEPSSVSKVKSSRVWRGLSILGVFKSPMWVKSSGRVF